MLWLFTFLLCISVNCGQPLPQDLSASQFYQKGRSLEGQFNEVTISTGYSKIRRQGRKGLTEVIQHNEVKGVQKTYETDVETKEILAKIDAINEALIDDSTIENNNIVEDEGRSSSNIFEMFWKQLLG